MGTQNEYCIRPRTRMLSKCNETFALWAARHIPIAICFSSCCVRYHG